MFNLKKSLLLYAVTDNYWTGEQTLAEQTEDALKGGATCIQLREKELSDSELLAEAISLKSLCKKYNVPFIVNDNVEVAIKSNADGIHVGQSDMEAQNVRGLIGNNMILGVSAQTVEQAIAAESAGADYLGVGAVFSTSTKMDADDVSLDTLRDICKAVKIPVVAIGGINRSNMSRLKGTGVDGVALVSAIYGAKNIENECKLLKVMAKGITSSMPTALTIAGSDSSGGAGIQADIKTMTANGVYAMSALTALTAQNTMGVLDILDVTPEFMKKQLDSIFEDIFPDAVKIGMVSNSELIEVIADKLSFYKPKHIIVDPVMVATSGASLLKPDAREALINKLIPLATMITPNIPEAEILSGMQITTKQDMLDCAEKISKKTNVSVLLKGGHSINDANDLLYSNGEYSWFMGTRINNPNTHGTGCTLSSAIASNLAKGYSLTESVSNAKSYISKALSYMLDLGFGSGPMNHMYKEEKND